jgi:hypothetical protein
MYQFHQQCDPKAEHRPYMPASQVGRYNNFDWLQQLTAQLGLETTIEDCVQREVRIAAAAIPAMTDDRK